MPVGPIADNPPGWGPAGTVHASLASWGRFVAAHLAGARGEGTFLQPATWQLLHAAPDGQDYAFGWVRLQRDWAGGTALFHNGSNTLWYCCAWLSPAKGFAVLATCNAGPPRAEKACDAVATVLVREAQRLLR
jgi:hypothetical protein